MARQYWMRDMQPGWIPRGPRRLTTSEIDRAILDKQSDQAHKRLIRSLRPARKETVVALCATVSAGGGNAYSVEESSMRRSTGWNPLAEIGSLTPEYRERLAAAGIL